MSSNINPTTTGPLALTQKDETRNAAEALVRLYSIQIKYNQAISTELKQALGIRQPTLSQQLGVLRNEGVVSTRREGKNIFYNIADARLLKVLELLYRLYCPKE